MELGGDFELDINALQTTEDHVFRYLEAYHTIYTDSGRSAARLLNTILPKGKILLPAYICSSVIKEYEDCFSIDFYRINPDFSIDLEDLERKLDDGVTALYLMHYFGRLQPEAIRSWLQRKKATYGFVIVEDTTHSIFTKPCTVGDYCVCSLRKWFPIADGGVLYSEKELGIATAGLRKKGLTPRLEAMLMKHMYVKHGVDCNALYRSIFAKEEQRLDAQADIFLLSDISRAMIEGISVSWLTEKRKENYRNLMEFLVEHKQRVIWQKDDFVPLVCPIYRTDRDAFRRYMQEHQVYCAVHWPLADTALAVRADARWIAEHIIALPVDQRYDFAHIEYMEKVIESYQALSAGEKDGDY